MAQSCLNCDQPLTGPYCAACGQKHLDRMSMGHWLVDSLRAFTDVDVGPLRTMRELTTQPGTVARNFVEGRRARYVNPLRYALVACALFVTVFAVVLRGTESAKAGLQIGNLVAAPLIALLVWIVFRRSGRSFADQLTLQLYLRGHALLVLSIASTAGAAFGSDVATGVQIAVGVALLGWELLAVQQFHRGTLPRVLVRTVIAVVLANAASAAVVIVAMRGW